MNPRRLGLSAQVTLASFGSWYPPGDSAKFLAQNAERIHALGAFAAKPQTLVQDEIVRLGAGLR